MSKVPVQPHRSTRRCQSRSERDRREASKAKTAPTFCNDTSATRRWKSGRLAIWVPERPRSRSRMRIRLAGQPSCSALSRSAYLTFGAFLVLAHLFESGLAQVDAGQLLAMGFLDRFGFHRRRPTGQEARRARQPGGRLGAWWRRLEPPAQDRSARPPQMPSFKPFADGARVRG